MTVKDSAAKALEFLNKHSKKIVVSLVMVAGLVVALACLYGWLYTRPLVIVNGVQITRADYSEAARVANKTAEYANDKLVALPKSVIDGLVERRILDIIAREKGLVVTDAEVDAMVGSNLDRFDNSKAKVVSTYMAAYGYKNEQEFRSAVHYALLREKAIAKMVSSKAGRFVYVRFNKANGVENITGLATDKLDAWAKGQIDVLKARLDSGENFDNVYNAAQTDPKYVYPAMYGAEFSDINSSTTGYSEATITAIKNLSQGKYSNVIKAPTFYAIYYVDRETNATQNSWDDVVNQYRSKYARFGFLGGIYAGQVDSLAVKILKFFGIKTAYAGSCSGCSGCIGARFHGRVYDSITHINISGAKVQFTNSTAPFCNGSTGPNAWCGYATRSWTTDSTGGTSDNYSYVRNGTACFANCGSGSPFKGTASKTNYNSLTSGNKYPTNGDPYLVNFALVPKLPTTYSLTVNVVPDDAAVPYNDGKTLNSGSSAQAGIEGSISNKYLQPPVLSGDCAGRALVPTSSMTYGDGTVGPGYLLSSSITMNSNKTCTMTFTPKVTHSTTILNSGTGTGNVSVYLEAKATCPWPGSDLMQPANRNDFPISLTTYAGDYNSDCSTYRIQAFADPSIQVSYSGCFADGTSACSVMVEKDNTVTVDFTPKTYTITVAANPPAGGTVVAEPSVVDYNLGSGVTAVPRDGYAFVGWGSNCGFQFNGNPNGWSHVTENKSCTANFAIKTNTLTYVAGAGGTISGTTPQTVNYGASGTSVTAVPNTGYRFVNWSDGNTSAIRTDANVTANVTYTATFAWINIPPTVTLVPPSLTCGMTSVTLEAYSVDDGNSQTMDFQLYGPSGSLVAESGWKPYAANNVHQTYTATGLAAGTYRWRAQSFDGSLYSSWVENYFTTVDCAYTLSTSVSSGSGAVSGAGTYTSGWNVYPVATPKDGWEFSSWGGDCAGQGASASLLMTGNKNCNANFSWVNTAPVVTLVSPVGNPILGQAPVSVTLEAYSVDDGNSQTMDFQLYGPGGNLVHESGWTPYVSNQVHQTTLASSLSDGTYRWRIQAYDGSFYSAWAEAYFTITAPPVSHNLSCTVSPEVGGASPLVVKVTASPVNVSAPYSYRMDAIDKPGDVQSGKPGVFYYTYSAPDSYQVQISSNQVDNDPVLGKWRTCTPTSFDVSASTSANGGEVAQ